MQQPLDRLHLGIYQSLVNQKSALASYGGMTVMQRNQPINFAY